jgi:hypothetical protein
LTLTQSGPNLSIPEHVLLQHFCFGLNKEAALHLDCTAGGSFAHKTPSEGRKLLDLILENTSSFDPINEPTPEESTSSMEEPSMAESEPIPSTSQDSPFETSPEPGTMMEEEILPPEFPLYFEEEFFEDYGNNSKYFCQKRPPVPFSPPDPNENNLIWESTSNKSSEWLYEDDPDIIQMSSPPLTIQCYIGEIKVDALYDPKVGANIVADSFAFAFLGDQPLIPTNKSFKRHSCPLL